MIGSERGSDQCAVRVVTPRRRTVAPVIASTRGARPRSVHGSALLLLLLLVTTACTKTAQVAETGSRSTLDARTSSSAVLTTTTLPEPPSVALLCGGSTSLVWSSTHTPSVWFEWHHTSGALPLRNWSINFGDGSPEAKAGSVDDAVFSHLYRRAGTYTVNLVVEDTLGQTGHGACTTTWDQEPLWSGRTLADALSVVTREWNLTEPTGSDVGTFIAMANAYELAPVELKGGMVGIPEFDPYYRARCFIRGDCEDFEYESWSE